MQLLNESNQYLWFVTAPPIYGITTDDSKFPDLKDANKKLSVQDAFDIEYGVSKTLNNIRVPTHCAEGQEFVTTLAEMEPAKRVLLWETRATENLLWTDLIGTEFDPRQFSASQGNIWVSRTGSFVRTLPEPFLGFVDQSDWYRMHPAAKAFAELSLKAQGMFRTVPDFLVFQNQTQSQMINNCGAERSLRLHFTACRWLVKEHKGKAGITFILFFPNAFGTRHMVGLTGWQEGMVLDPLGALLCGMQRHVHTTTARPLQPMLRKMQKGCGTTDTKPKTLFRLINIPALEPRPNNLQGGTETKVELMGDVVRSGDKKSSGCEWRGSWDVKAHTRRIRNKKTGEVKVVEVKAFTKQKDKAPIPTVYIVSR